MNFFALIVTLNLWENKIEPLTERHWTFPDRVLQSETENGKERRNGERNIFNAFKTGDAAAGDQTGRFDPGGWKERLKAW